MTDTGRNHLYSVSEVCSLLGISERTLRRWISQQRIAAIKLGRQWRISRCDLEAFLSAHRSHAVHHVL
ncbi:MAG: helix-turn-helix domain-containing protein [Alphaproteobacteria bacterium]|nr:helix-turn-helix domain-containing protein [Alphaproteobacteria bacterium]